MPLDHKEAHGNKYKAVEYASLTVYINEGILTVVTPLDVEFVMDFSLLLFVFCFFLFFWYLYII
jgi:hypothetical protein